MAKTKPKNPLTRQQKLFRMVSLYPLDANNLDIDEAVSRLFVYLRTLGRQIMRTDKVIFTGESEDAETPKAVLDAVLAENGQHFSGIDSDERKSLIRSWLESHFALMSRRGKAKGGSYRMSGLRPLHFMVIKLFNPRVKRQDRYLSDFFYNSLKNDPTLSTNTDSLLKQFFGLGVRNHGDNDYRINEQELQGLAQEHKLDVELLFLLRLLEPFETDKYSTKKDDQVPELSFLCPEQIELMRQDLKLLFLYKDCIPRRELINYMTTLMVFHAALYFYQIVRISNSMVEKGKLPAPRGAAPAPGEPRSHAPFQLDFFCDMTGGHDDRVDYLSKQRFIEHFKEIEQYFQSAYLMKKLEEFAGSYLSQDQKKHGGKAYIELLLTGYLKHKDLDGYFARDLSAIQEASKDPESGEANPEIDRIIQISNKRGLNRLQTFVEILYHSQYGTLREQHRKLLAGLCGSDSDRGFMAGRGRTRRKYVIGNELLEVLIQLAVLERRTSDGKWQTRPVPISHFTDWLSQRYGLLIDTLGANVEESEADNRAMASNFEAFKTRLRQLGFFRDLADASNSQVIEPRFRIIDGKLEDDSSAA